MIVGFQKEMKKSMGIFQILMALVVALTTPRYSTSLDEREIENYFLLYQETRSEPREKQYPKVDLWFWELPTQSEFVYLTKSISTPTT